MMEQEKNSSLVLSWIRRIRPEVRVVVLSAVMTGIVCHGTALFNKLSLRDDIAYLFTPGMTLTHGRWMLYVLSWLEGLFYGTGNASLPLFNGLLSILWIGIAGGMLADLLQIRKRRYCALMGVLLVAFPFVTALFAYMFASHFFMLALVMMILSACLICRGNPWWVKAGAVLIGAASIGIYQAHLSFLLSVILLYDIMVLTDRKTRVPDFLKMVGVQAICVAGTLIVYFAINRFFLAKYSIELTGYMGLDQMGALSVTTYLERCVTAYREFINPARGEYQDMYPGTLHMLYRLMILGEALLAARQVYLTGKENKRRAVLLAAVLILVPLACDFIYVMSDFVHGVMIYGQVMHFVLLIWLLDHMELRWNGIQRVASLLASAVLAVTGLMFVRYDHQCYLKATLHQQQAISYWTTIVTQIKSLDGYRSDMKLEIIGDQRAADPTIYPMEEMEFIRLVGYDSYDNWFMYNGFEWIMKRWCGYTQDQYWGSTIYSLPEIQAMPAYPADGSIQIIGDVIVVKLS